MQNHPGLHLSQSDEAAIFFSCQLAAVEIKSPDGSYYGASVQLAIWLAAGLEKMRQLKELAAAASAASAGTSSPLAASSSAPVPASGGAAPVPGAGDAPDHASPLLTYPGIAVVGQAWYLHLATKSADGTVVSTSIDSHISTVGLIY